MGCPSPSLSPSSIFLVLRLLFPMATGGAVAAVAWRGKKSFLAQARRGPTRLGRAWAYSAQQGATFCLPQV